MKSRQVLTAVVILTVAVALGSWSPAQQDLSSDSARGTDEIVPEHPVAQDRQTSMEGLRESLQGFGNRVAAVRSECAPDYAFLNNRRAGLSTNMLAATLEVDFSDEIVLERANSMLKDMFSWLIVYESEMKSRCLGYDDLVSTLASLQVGAESLWPRIKSVLAETRGSDLIGADSIPIPRDRAGIRTQVSAAAEYGFSVSQGSLEDFMVEYLEVQDGRVRAKSVDGIVTRVGMTRDEQLRLYRFGGPVGLTKAALIFERFTETVGGGRYVFEFDQPGRRRDVVPSVELLNRAVPYLQGEVTARCIQRIQDKDDAAFARLWARDESTQIVARNVVVGEWLYRLFQETVANLDPHEACSPDSTNLVDRFRATLMKEVLRLQDAARIEYEEKYRENYGRSDWTTLQVMNDLIATGRIHLPAWHDEVVEMQRQFNVLWEEREKRREVTSRVSMGIQGDLEIARLAADSGIKEAFIAAFSQMESAEIMGQAQRDAAEITGQAQRDAAEMHRDAMEMQAAARLIPNISVPIPIPLPRPSGGQIGGSHVPSLP